MRNIDRFPAETKFESDRLKKVEVFDYKDYVYNGNLSYLDLKDWVYEKIHHMP